MPGMDAWVQLAVNVTLSALVVLLVEVYVVPRVTRRLAAEEAARAERQEKQAARRAEELQRRTLEHAERVAREARYTDALFDLRGLLREARAVLWSIEALGPLDTEVFATPGIARHRAAIDGLQRFRLLMDTIYVDASYLRLPAVAEQARQAHNEVVPVLRREEPFSAHSEQVEARLNQAAVLAHQAVHRSLTPYDDLKGPEQVPESRLERLATILRRQSEDGE